MMSFKVSGGSLVRVKSAGDAASDPSKKCQRRRSCRLSNLEDLGLKTRRDEDPDETKTATAGIRRSAQVVRGEVLRANLLSMSVSSDIFEARKSLASCLDKGSARDCSLAAPLSLSLRPRHQPTQYYNTISYSRRPHSHSAFSDFPTDRQQCLPDKSTLPNLYGVGRSRRLPIPDVLSHVSLEDPEKLKVNSSSTSTVGIRPSTAGHAVQGRPDLDLAVHADLAKTARADVRRSADGSTTLAVKPESDLRSVVGRRRGDVTEPAGQSPRRAPKNVAASIFLEDFEDLESIFVDDPDGLDFLTPGLVAKATAEAPPLLPTGRRGDHVIGGDEFGGLGEYGFDRVTAECENFIREVASSVSCPASAFHGTAESGADGSEAAGLERSADGGGCLGNRVVDDDDAAKTSRLNSIVHVSPESLSIGILTLGIDESSLDDIGYDDDGNDDDRNDYIGFTTTASAATPSDSRRRVGVAVATAGINAGESTSSSMFRMLGSTTISSSSSSPYTSSSSSSSSFSLSSSSLSGMPRDSHSSETSWNRRMTPMQGPPVRGSDEISSGSDARSASRPSTIRVDDYCLVSCEPQDQSRPSKTGRDAKVSKATLLRDVSSMTLDRAFRRGFASCSRSPSSFSVNGVGGGGGGGSLVATPSERNTSLLAWIKRSAGKVDQPPSTPRTSRDSLAPPSFLDSLRAKRTSTSTMPRNAKYRQQANSKKDCQAGSWRRTSEGQGRSRAKDDVSSSCGDIFTAPSSRASNPERERGGQHASRNQSAGRTKIVTAFTMTGRLNRSSSSLATRRSEDELDRTSNSSAGDPGSPRTPGAAGVAGGGSSGGGGGGGGHQTPSLIKRVQSTPSSSAPRKLSLGNISSPIGIDEESFTKTFNQVPKVSIYSAKDFTERVAKVRDVLADQNLDWSKRVDALKEIRAWLTNQNYDAKGHPEFPQTLVTLEPLFHATVRDLRSQVVRETCITVAFLSQELGKDFGHFAETILPPLVSLIPNSAKIMAASATVAIKFILQNTHNNKLIPILASNLSSKSNIIRRQCYELVGFVLQSWPAAVVEKQLPVVQEAIRRGIGDADSEARLNSRKAFWNFSENFKAQADRLLQSLDPSKQRQLMGEQQGSSSSSLVDLGDNGRASSTNGIAVATTPSSSSPSCAAGQGRAARRFSGATAVHDRAVPSSGYGRRISKDRPDAGHTASDLDLTSLTDKMSKVGIGGGNGQNNRSQALYGTLRKSKAYSSMSSSKQSQAGSSLASSSLASSSLASSSLATSCDEQTLLTSLKIASSRSSSPAPRLSYITQIQPDVVPQSAVGFGSRRRSTTGLNKSREGSRDSSPNRSFGRERRPSGQAKARGRNLTMQRSGDDFPSSRSKTGPSSTCDSDDVNSETSSVCSDGSSYWNCGRQVTEDTSEIIACLSSGSWSDRRDGLLALQHLLNNNRTLSRNELKKVTDIFSRMFHDPHGKVFGVFTETLSQLVVVHHGDMHDWLYILMTRLLAKTGADLLGSTQAKIQRTLDTVRSSFPTNQQFMLLSKLLIDQTQSPNLKEKVKVAMLCYLHGLTQLMSPSDFVNTSDVRLAISRIITWTTEPKSVDVRKAAQAALLSLHALNQPEFELIMSVLPKTFQEGAERILQNRSHHSGQSSEAQSLKDPSSPVGTNGAGQKLSQPSSSSPAPQPQQPQLLQQQQQLRQATSDEIYDSIRRTSEDIHALVEHGSARAPKRSELPVKSLSLASTRGALPVGPTVESRIPSFLQNLPDVDIVAKMASGRGRKDSCNGAIQSWFGVSNVIKKEREEAERNACETQVMLSVPAMLQELSHHNDRIEERKSCLLQLMKRAREETEETWDEYFNTVLLILLETLADNDGNIRALSLRVLSEFLRCHPERFHEYVELTVVRSLEAHKDSVKEVTRAAEECSNLLSRIISPDRSHVVLGPLIESDDFPINLAAVKMMTQIVEEAEASVVSAVLPRITPSLLKAYDNAQSSVRKASVICLVAVYMSVGEELRPHLHDLHGSKVKLLNVYIKRALDQQAASSCGTSKTSSPTSVIEA